MFADALWEELYTQRLLSFNHRAIYLKALTLARRIEVRSIVEVGVYAGHSSEFFRLLFPKATLYLVDPWKATKNYLKKEAGPMSQDTQAYTKAYERVREMFKDDPEAHILRMTSQRASKQIPDGIDLVFIDANHSYSYVKRDIRLWLPKVRPGGILSGHDYNPDKFQGVVRAVDEAFEKDLILGLDHVWSIIK